MNIATFSLRNIIRNSHRTLVTSLAMAFACAMMIMFSTLMEGFVAGSERNVVEMNTGDIQIHRSGYRDDPDIYDVVEHSATLASQLRAAGFAVTERQFAYGLMASNESSSGVQLRGVDLQFEHTVTKLHQYVLTGQWLAKSDPHGVVIGKKLARLLDVKLDDELVFVGQTADGFMANDTFYIRGILKSVSANLDNAAVFMSNQMLRQLIALNNEVSNTFYLARNYMALGASYEFTPLLNGDAIWIFNHHDQSSLLALYSTYSLSDESELSVGMNVSLGQQPQNGTVQSEFGSYSKSVNVEYRIYF